MTKYIPGSEYIPEKDYYEVNGLKIYKETEIDKRFKLVEKTIKEMNDKNKKLRIAIGRWFEMIELLKKISKDIKEIKEKEQI